MTLPRPRAGARLVQYRPPAGLSVVEAAELLQRNSVAVVAQLVDFAARKVIVMRPGERRRSFVAVLTDVPVTSEAERAILSALFGGSTAAGSRVRVTRRRNDGMSRRLADAHREVASSLTRRGLMRERPWALRMLQFWNPRPLEATEAAGPLLDHLWGLHDYISLAEAERMRVLQSPDSAIERVADEGESVLVIHERLLGYAVLFGLEKQWAARILADSAASGRDVSELDALSWADPAIWEAASAAVDLVSSGVEAASATDGIEGVASAASGIDPMTVDAAVAAVDILDGLGSFLSGL